VTDSASPCREKENLDDKQKSLKWLYHIESKEKGGNTAIEAFVNEALTLYKKQQQSAKVDVSRYM
jgi:hypothetical protein